MAFVEGEHCNSELDKCIINKGEKMNTKDS